MLNSIFRNLVPPNPQGHFGPPPQLFSSPDFWTLYNWVRLLKYEETLRGNFSRGRVALFRVTWGCLEDCWNWAVERVIVDLGMDIILPIPAHLARHQIMLHGRCCCGQLRVGCAGIGVFEVICIGVCKLTGLRVVRHKKVEKCRRYNFFYGWYFFFSFWSPSWLRTLLKNIFLCTFFF